MKKHIRILIVEDGKGEAERMGGELKRAGLKFQSNAVQSRETLLEELEKSRPDVILSHNYPRACPGYELLQTARAKAPDVP
ncbi:MAG TPA: hypothetical protein VMZ27_08425, partial [Candidatus Saccharimonadales bacterium]|nr:hypothetical protein [Candidatus Saccharimonadales bacterium]